MTTWTIDPSGLSASTIYANGSTESRLLSAIPVTDTIIPLTSAQLSAQQWAAYQLSAKLALMSSDETVTRVSEAISLGLTTATTSDVVTFMQYRKSLRAILTQAQPTTIPTSLPTKPPYPANT